MLYNLQVENAKFEVFSLTKLGSDSMSISLEVNKLAITQMNEVVTLVYEEPA
jgi:hypothetical protein